MLNGIIDNTMDDAGTGQGAKQLYNNMLFFYKMTYDGRCKMSNGIVLKTVKGCMALFGTTHTIANSPTNILKGHSVYIIRHLQLDIMLLIY